MKLVFATNNKHKLEEISKMAVEHIQIVSLSEIGCFDEIPETGNTLQENALQKSQYIFDKYGLNCFADDTGLEIEALNGAPGVITARFAGENCTPKDNIEKTLSVMQGIENRKACFRTIISFILNGKEYQFEGRVDGEIATEIMGEGGFGYDPIFIPEGYETSFAQMPLDEKNKISHRGRATAKFLEFINKL